jgi:Uma2 family endonuclease
MPGKPRKVAVPRPTVPMDLASLAEWPLPVSRVDFDDGLAFVYAARAGGYTAFDLAAAPDDSRRYEVLDGVLVVSPCPLLPHQRAVVRLSAILLMAEVGTATTLVAPYDVKVSVKKNFQPDLLVLPDRESTLPVLVVEVLSKYGRRYDRQTKRAAYQAAGIASYWIVDPGEPSVTVLELDDDNSDGDKGGDDGDRDGYREVGVIRGDDLVELTRPYPVRFRPSDLLA